MGTDQVEESAADELQALLEEHPEVLKELDADLIRVCEELEVV
jgi:hypothetical protein